MRTKTTEGEIPMNYDAAEGQNFITREKDRYTGLIVTVLSNDTDVELFDVTYLPTEGVFSYTGYILDTTIKVTLRREEFYV